jgi:hypothetical protein
VNIKPIFIVFAFSYFLIGKCFSAESNSPADVSMYCNRSAAEADISTNLYETGTESSISIQLLSGNTQGALDQLGSELALKVVILNENLKKNPCSLDEKTLARIYPMLRVVAAVNHVKAIPKINDDKNIMEILSQAIKDNPDHYNKLIERSKNWGHGIQ